VSDSVSARPANAGRIVLDTFRSSYDPMLKSWLLFRAQILPELAVVPPDLPAEVGGDARERARSGRYGVWRILATNNRELGRGAGLHATPSEALIAAQDLQGEADDLHTSVVRGTQPMTHGWVLRHDGAPVMTSSRWYESASEASSAARTARTVLATATIVRGVNIGTQSGRRHRRAIVPVNPLA
jgi:hypothetical protein